MKAAAATAAAVAAAAAPARGRGHRQAGQEHQDHQITVGRGSRGISERGHSNTAYQAV